MEYKKISAIAHPNIAFIKYWGNRDDQLRLPVNGSISMNLAGLQSKTSVQFDPTLKTDNFLLGNKAAGEKAIKRVTTFLDLVRKLGNFQDFAYIESHNNFPMGSGIASSSSAFAALALAASLAAEITLTEKELSVLARKGSGSASRSIPGGFVEWHAGTQDEDSYAESFADAKHWDLADCIAIVDDQHKSTGSTEGHPLAKSSPLQEARIAGAPARLKGVREAILSNDFDHFAKIVEDDSHLMHAVMMTSSPRLMYWQAASVRVLKACAAWRNEGLTLCTTMDAGPNVHVLCLSENQKEIVARLNKLEGVKEVLQARPGPAAQLINY